MNRYMPVLCAAALFLVMTFIQGCTPYGGSASYRVNYYSDPWYNDYHYRTRIYYHHNNWHHYRPGRPNRPDRPKPPPSMRPPRPTHPIARPPRPTLYRK